MKTILIILGIFLIANDALSCSCIEMTPEEAFEKASVVFIGKVIAKGDNAIEIEYENNGTYGTYVSLATKRIYLFKISKYFKGIQSHKYNNLPIAITTGVGGGDCGYDFVDGREYLVYAYKEGNKFITSICSRTAEKNSANEDISFLMSRTIDNK